MPFFPLKIAFISKLIPVKSNEVVLGLWTQCHGKSQTSSVTFLFSSNLKQTFQGIGKKCKEIDFWCEEISSSTRIEGFL